MERNSLHNGVMLCAVMFHLLSAQIAASESGPQCHSIQQDDVPFTVEQPGHYMLEEDLEAVARDESVLSIAADDVSIDMQNHTIRGMGHALAPAVIQRPGFHNLAISNGFIRSWQRKKAEAPPVHAIDAQGQSNRFVWIDVRDGGKGLLAGPHAYFQWCQVQEGQRGITAGALSTLDFCTTLAHAEFGTQAGDGSSVIKCTAFSNETGIVVGDKSSMEQCSSYANRGTGIRAGRECLLDFCSAFQNDIGIQAAPGAKLFKCSTHENLSDGIQLEDDNSLLNCSTAANGRYGVSVGNRCEIDRLFASDNAGAGIIFHGKENVMRDSQVTENHVGIILLEGEQQLDANRVFGNKATDREDRSAD